MNSPFYNDFTKKHLNPKIEDSLSWLNKLPSNICYILILFSQAERLQVYFASNEKSFRVSFRASQQNIDPSGWWGRLESRRLKRRSPSSQTETPLTAALTVNDSYHPYHGSVSVWDTERGICILVTVWVNLNVVFLLQLNLFIMG